MNLANGLSLIRILFVPILLYLLNINFGTYSSVICLVVFLLAASTDYFDGLAARLLKCETNWGKLLDPLADKILVIGVLLFFVSNSKISYIPVLIIIIRDFFVFGLRSLSASQGIVVKADLFGKFKTVWQYITVCWLIMEIPYSNQMVLIMIILTVLSGFNYFYVNKEIFKND